jgi:GNAT superfamily N-acetyltransferase
MIKFTYNLSNYKPVKLKLRVGHSWDTNAIWTPEIIQVKKIDRTLKNEEDIRENWPEKKIGWGYKSIDYQKLKDGIDEFQKELPLFSRAGFSIEDAEKRLEDGWWFHVLSTGPRDHLANKLKGVHKSELEGEGNSYVGWSWFDTPNKQFCNLYVCKEAMDKGYGKQLVYSGLNECKGQNIQKVWIEVEDWNRPIQKICKELETVGGKLRWRL